MVKSKMHAIIAYTLLLAMFTAAVPYHQLFHQHKTAKHENSAQVTSHENPCCKIVQSYTSQLTENRPVLVFNTFSETFILSELLHPAVKFNYSLQNKAPPVIA